MNLPLSLPDYLDNFQITPNPSVEALFLYDFQKYIINDWSSHKLNVLMNARQIGASTMIIADAIYGAYMGKYVAILTNTEYQARCIKESIERHLNVNGISHIIFKSTNTCIEFEFGGKIFIRSASTSSVRGLSYDVVYIMDYDYMNGQTELMKSLIPIISSRRSSKIVLQSTPKPTDDNDYCIKSLSKHPSYWTNIVNWNVVPDRDAKWKKEMIALIGEDSWNVEFEMPREV